MTDAGFDEWLAAVAAGEAYYRACPDGHGSLPPRRVCPHCGSGDLRDEPLPETGVVETATTVQVSTPDFAAETPYTNAIADFGPVRITGVLRGAGADSDAVGLTVGVTVEETTDGDELVVLRPV